MADKLHAFIDDRPYTTALIVATFGLLTFTIAHKWSALDTHPTTRLVCEHLALAFVIAGIVGFGYEFSGHSRRMKRIVDRLSEQSDDVLVGFERTVSSQVAEFNTVLEARASDYLNLVNEEAVKALPRAFEAIFRGTPDKADLEERSVKLYRALRTIQMRNMWIDNISLLFIGALLGLATRSACKLASVGENDGEPLTLKLPYSSAVLADEILADEMDGLRQGDSYLVVSDFGSWAWPPEKVFAGAEPCFTLDKFYTAMVNAVKDEDRRVVVRRLFSKFNRDGALTQAQAEGILKRHWEAIPLAARDECGQPLYQIGVLPRRVWAEIGLDQFHQGLFIHGGQAICFMPQEPSLDEMQFRMLPDAGPLCAVFENLWQRAVRSCGRDASGAVVENSLQKVLIELGTDWWQ